MFSMLRITDVLLIVIDLSGDPLSEADEVISELDRYGFRLLGEGEDADPEEHRVQKRVVLVANKSDTEGADVALELLEELYGAQLPIIGVSAPTSAGLDDLGCGSVPGSDQGAGLPESEGV